MTRKLRLLSGIVLFVFVTGHLINLGFGLVSVDVLDRLRPVFMAPWSNPVGMVLLIGSMMGHTVLGLLTLYRRQTLRLTRLDASQLLLGLAIPPLLLPHVLGVAVGPKLSGASIDYATILTFYWVLAPAAGVQQVLALVVTWIHGCMGLFVWMRLQRWWPRVAGVSYPLVVVIPVLALLGLVEAGKEVVARQADPGFMAPITATVEQVGAVIDQLAQIERRVLAGYAALLALVLIAWAIRVRGVTGQLRLSYVDGPEVVVAAGPTILELSRIHEVPHANLCQGRGRCGTCRVRVLDGGARLPAAAPIEAETLAKIEAPAGVRLACQLAPPAGALRIERLLPGHVEPRDLARYRSAAPAANVAAGLPEAV